MLFYFILCIGLADVTLGNPLMEEDNVINDMYPFSFVDRAGWQARKPTLTTPLPKLRPYVVIHHSFTPSACYTSEDCKQAMRTMQNMHVDGNGWWDIGYNFAVGSDGVAYEGRGWDKLGAHALHFNNVSIGICLIGDWSYQLPTPQQMRVAQQLIQVGIQQGYLRKDYKLVGHRQVRETECPGEALFTEIKTWENYSKFPASFKDLIYIEELSNATKS